MALRSRARGYLSELRRTTYPEKSHSSFCSLFFPDEFLAAASNLFSSPAIGPDKVVYPMLKHLPRSGMDFLLHIFNLGWSLHSFSCIRKTSIIPIHKMRKPLNPPASFRSLSPAFQSCLNATLYLVYSSFCSLTPFSVHARPVSAMDGLLLIKFRVSLKSILDGFNQPRSGSHTTLLLLLITQLLPSDDGTPGAAEAGQLSRAWDRGRRETGSRQRASGAKSP